MKTSNAGWGIVTRWRRVSVAFFLLALLLHTPSVSSQEVPISINLLLIGSSERTAVKVVDYLEKLIEKRTDTRLAANIYSRPASLDLLETEKQLGSKIHLIVINDVQFDENRFNSTDLTLIKGENAKLRMLAVTTFWKELPSDLQIILQGAIKDALAYSAELER